MCCVGVVHLQISGLLVIFSIQFIILEPAIMPISVKTQLPFYLFLTRLQTFWVLIKIFPLSSNHKFFQFLKSTSILVYHKRSQTAGYNHYSKLDFTDATYLVMKTYFLLLTRFLLSSFVVKSVHFHWFSLEILNWVWSWKTLSFANINVKKKILF